uniref:Uncharacterized protein n=1 Tax=Ciona savignyi TaxID=51511 RepID=H2ZCA8_CIOSA
MDIDSDDKAKLNLSDSSGQKHRKRRTLEFADSSDDSGSEDVTGNKTLADEKEIEDVSCSANNISLQDSSENDESSAESTSETGVRKKKKRSRRLKIAESSSDESESESVVNDPVKLKSPKKMMSTPQLDDEPCCSKQTSDGLNKDGKPSALDFRETSSSSDSENDDPIRMFRKSKTGDDAKSDSENSSSGCSSESSSEDDAPPLRIFRNPDAAARNDRGADLDASSDDEGINIIPASRKPKRPFSDNHLEIKSETQRIIRESRVNLPYFVPEAKKLSEFMKRPVCLLDRQIKSEPDQKEDDLKMDADTGDSGIGGPDKIESEKSSETSTQISKTVPVSATQNLSKTAKLLEARGVAIPKLNVLTRSDKPVSDIIRFDDDDAAVPKSEVTSFMQRFLKHSNVGKRNLKKKKVHFDIIRKEERKDGTGVELVTEIVEFSDPTLEDSSDSKDLTCVSHGEKYRRL